jgi:type VI secretion system protein ImpJ
MRMLPEIHWSEGMFLRPQHLQFLARHVAAQVADSSRRAQPFFWGVSEIEVADDQLEGGTFGLRRFAAILKDGTAVQLPTNLRISPRAFKDALAGTDGRLLVWLGVPVLVEGEANVPGPEATGEDHDHRFVVDTIEAADENLGGPAQPIEIRKLNGRFFFGTESREGYECLAVAMIQRAGAGKNAPVLAKEFIPPVTTVGVWPELVRLTESISNRVDAKYRFLRAEVAEGRIVLDAAGSGNWQPILKLQIVGSFLHVLRQLKSVPGVHPFQVYLEFCRLAGELSIFEERGAEGVEVPPYDHDKLGECFHELVFILERLLEKILSGGFVRVEFELEGELLMARLQQEWLAGENEMYLCIESDLDDRSLMTRIETAKLGTSTDIPLLKQRRLFGLDIELLKRTPGGLPSRENFHYFSVAREGPYWDAVARAREMAVSGGIDQRLKFVLYVVLRGGPATGVRS